MGNFCVEKRKFSSENQVKPLQHNDKDLKLTRFYSGHFANNSIVVDIAFVSLKNEYIIFAKNVLIDTGFTGGVLLSSNLAKLLEIKEIQAKEFQLGDETSLIGVVYASLNNEIIFIGRDSADQKHPVKLMKRNGIPSIFVPETGTNQILLGLQFLEQFYICVDSEKKNCNFGYILEKEKKENVREYKVLYGELVNKNQEKTLVAIQSFKNEGSYDFDEIMEMEVQQQQQKYLI